MYEYVKSGCEVCQCENFWHANTRDGVATESEIKSSPHLFIIFYSVRKMCFWQKFINPTRRSVGRLRIITLNQIKMIRRLTPAVLVHNIILLIGSALQQNKIITIIMIVAKITVNINIL